MYLQDHLEKLAYFYKVASLGSVKDASKALNLTQPSVTKSIKALEEAIGSNLFIRKPRGMSLTKEGELLKKYCHTLFAQIKDIEVKLKSPDDPLAGSLKVGTYDSIAIYFWPKFLKKFLKKYTKLDLELTTDRSRNIQRQVEAGELDLGLIIEPNPSHLLEVINLSVDTFQLYVSTKMSKSEIESAMTPLIFMPDALADENQNRLAHLLGVRNISRKQFKTSSLESAKELVVGGIGIGLLPKMVAEDAIIKKKIKVFRPNYFPKAGLGMHHIGLVFPKYSVNSAPLQTLIEEIKQQDWQHPSN
ncbi:MAG: LysR family transcriptional regulator [Bdellovibrionota bacterium]